MKESATEGLGLVAEAGLANKHRASFSRMLGDVSGQEGDYEGAMKLVEVSLTLSRKANDVNGIVHSLLLLGIRYEVLGGLEDLERARELFEEGLTFSRELGSSFVRSTLLNSLGFAHLYQGNLEQAKLLFEESALLDREAGHRVSLDVPLGSLGWVALLEGNLERARTLHKECLAFSNELGAHKQFVPEILEGLACAAGAGGEAETAARPFGAAAALREAMGVPLEPAFRTLEDPYLLGARFQLEEDTWIESWEAGRAMSLEQAIEYALSEEKTIISPPPESEQPSSDGPPRLTRREEQVALLVTRGLTNRQIASEHFLSEHTVHHHLTNILKKLNLTSRQQVASHLPDR